MRFMSKKNLSQETNAAVGRLSTALGADVQWCVSPRRPGNGWGTLWQRQGRRMIQQSVPEDSPGKGFSQKEEAMEHPCRHTPGKRCRWSNLDTWSSTELIRGTLYFTERESGKSMGGKLRKQQGTCSDGSVKPCDFKEKNVSSSEHRGGAGGGKVLWAAGKVKELA